MPPALFSRDHLRMMVNAEIQSILDNGEKALLYCKNKLHTLPGVWNGGELLMQGDASTIASMCGDERPLILHTHMLYSASPSAADFIGYKKLPGNPRGFCTIGVDRVQCYDDRNQPLFRHDWTHDEFDLPFTDRRGNVFTGKNLFCDDLISGNNETERYCELNDDGKDPIPIGKFKSVSMSGGVTSLKVKGADVAMYADEGNERIACYAMDGIPELFCTTIQHRVTPSI